MSLTSGLQIPFGIQPTIAVPVDSYSGPYEGADAATAIAAANAAIPSAARFKSMEVRLIIGGLSYKYWYKDGTLDANLVEFISSSLSISNPADNRVLTSTGVSSGINAESNLTFDGTDLTVTGDINVNGATSADIKTTTSTATVFDQPATLSLGGAATSLTVGGSTGASTTNIANGVTTTGLTKTVKIGTDSGIGSTTDIKIGSTLGLSVTTVNGALSVTGNTTLGDASIDVVTFKGSTVSIPNNLNFDTNTLYIDATNNRVGIGSNSPTATLDVAGDVSIAGSTTLGDNSTDGITFNASTLSIPNNLRIGGNFLYLDKTNFRVGIVTTSPSEALDVNGNIKSSGNITIAGTGNSLTTINPTLNLGFSGALSTLAVTTNISTETTASGYTKSLNIGTGGGSGSTTNISIGSVFGVNNTISLFGDLSSSGGSVSLANTLYCDNALNRIGIGNSSPTATLDVTGDVKVSGDLAVNGGDITTTASTLNIGANTSGFTANIATGTTTSGFTKAVNIGTDSGASSITNIKIGSTLGTSTTTVNGALSVTGNTTLGDASGDTLTFNASTVSIPNNLNFGSNSLYINSTSTSVGVGINSAKAKIDVYGDGLFRTTANSTNGVIYHNPLGDGSGSRIDFGTYGTGNGTTFADHGNIGAYLSKLNINAKGRDISFKIDDVEKMNLSSTSPYSLTLTDGSILMSSTSARAITHTGASGQNLTISSTNGNVIVKGSSNVSIQSDLDISPSAGSTANINTSKASFYIGDASSSLTNIRIGYGTPSTTKTVTSVYGALSLVNSGLYLKYTGHTGTGATYIYDVATNDFCITFNAAGDQRIVLPGTDTGRILLIRGAATGVKTIAAASGDTINTSSTTGLTSFSLASQYEAWILFAPTSSLWYAFKLS